VLLITRTTSFCVLSSHAPPSCLIYNLLELIGFDLGGGFLGELFGTHLRTEDLESTSLILLDLHILGSQYHTVVLVVVRSERGERGVKLAPDVM
jgi:hypothetical protein